MEEVPIMISTKDLAYIEDIFNWNFNAAKTANDFSEKVEDEEIKEFIEDTYEMHKNICQTLINTLSLEEEKDE